MAVKDDVLETLSGKLQSIIEDQQLMKLLGLAMNMYPEFKERHWQAKRKGRLFDDGEKICLIMEELQKYGFKHKTKKQHRVFIKAMTLVKNLLDGALNF